MKFDIKYRSILLCYIYLFLTCAYASFLQDMGPDAVLNFKDQINTIAWHPTGKLCAVGGERASIVIFQFDGEKFLEILAEDFGNSVCCLKWSSDGKYLAVGGIDKSGGLLAVYEWRDQELDNLSSISAQTRVDSLDWGEDDSILAVGWFDAKNGATINIYDWDGAILTDLAINQPFGSAVYSLEWSPNKLYLAAGGDNGDQDIVIFYWNGSVLSQVDSKPFENFVKSIAWNPDGKFLAAGGNNPSSNIMVFGWDGYSLINNGSASTAQFGERANSVVWSKDGKFLGVGGYRYGRPLNDGMIGMYFWDGVSKLSSVMDMKYFGTNVNAVAWSPNTKFFAVGGIALPRTGICYFSPYTSSISGKFNNIDITYPYIFHDFSNSAGGTVKFEEGFSVLQNAQAYLDLYLPVTGNIDLRDTGVVILDGDIFLDSTCTISGGGMISGCGHSLFLNGNLKIPSGSYSVLEISDDLVIDGQNNELTFDPNCQLLIDGGITLTLKNIVIKNTYNDTAIPCIKCLDQSSKLVLDNVKFSPDNDFVFSSGQLFIHNDVVFSGSSQFVYKSVKPSFIESNSNLIFEEGTSFFYQPSSIDNDLINFADKTSKIYFNGCSLKTTLTGMILNTGTIIFDSKITISTDVNYVINPNTQTGGVLDVFSGSQTFGYPSRLNWSPNGKFVVISSYEEPLGGKLKVYSFVKDAADGGLQEVAPGEQYFGDLKGQVEAVEWSPNGKYVAASGFSKTSPSDFRGAIKIYRLVEGGTQGGLEEVSSGEFYFNEFVYTGVYTIAWSPDGQYLAAGNMYFDTVLEGHLKVFHFAGEFGEGGLEEAFDGYQILASRVFNVAWSPDGQFLAAAGTDESSGEGVIKVYRFTKEDSGGGLEEVGSGMQIFGAEVYSVSWSPDGRHLVAANYFYDMELDLDLGQINAYEFTNSGSTGGLTAIGTEPLNFGTTVYRVAWTPDGNYVIAANYEETDMGSSGNVKAFKFAENSSTGGLEEVGSGSYAFGIGLSNVSVSPDGAYVAVTSDDLGIKVFQLDYGYFYGTQSIINGLIFDDGFYDLQKNLDVFVLSGANMNIASGVVSYNTGVLPD